jgi:hypothetical protein
VARCRALVGPAVARPLLHFASVRGGARGDVEALAAVAVDEALGPLLDRVQSCEPSDTAAWSVSCVPAVAPVRYRPVFAVACRFLQGYEGIRPATRERVAAALEYRPNLTARSLTTGRSMRIGALPHELDQFGLSKIIQGAARAARDAGYVLDILSLDMGDPEEIDRALQTVTQHDLAGVLALASTDHMAQTFATANFRVPAFLAGEEDEFASHHPSQLTTVGFPALIDHLAELGHQRLLHDAGPTAWSAARNRARAFETAVVVANDQMALLSPAHHPPGRLRRPGPPRRRAPAGARRPVRAGGRRGADLAARRPPVHGRGGTVASAAPHAARSPSGQWRQDRGVRTESAARPWPRCRGSTRRPRTDPRGAATAPGHR